MRSGHLVSLVGAALLIVGGFGCAGVTPKASGTAAAPAPAVRAPLRRRLPRHPDDRGRRSRRKCGNGTLDPGEACDDGNKTAGDGCSADLPGARRLDVHGSPSVCNMARRLRRRHPRRDRGVRRRQHDGRRRLLGRLQDVETGCDAAFPGRPCVPAVRRRHDHRRRGSATTATRRTATAARRSARSSRARRCPTTGRRQASKCTGAVCGNGVKEGERGLRLRHHRPTFPPAARDRTACSSATAPAARRPARRSRAAATRPARRRPAPRAAATAPSRRARTATTATPTAATAARRRASSRAGFMCSTRWRTTTPSTARSPATPASASSCPSSTATSRTRASAAATPTSSTWARRHRRSEHHRRRTARPARSRSASATASRTRAVRRRRTTRRTAAGTSRRRTSARTASRRSTRRAPARAATRSLRLPVHRLEPRRQRRPRPRLHAATATARPNGSPTPTAPAATRCTAARRRSSPARRRSASGGPTALYTEQHARRRHARDEVDRRAPTSTSSRARSTR